MVDGLEIRPVRGIGDVTAGDDLAELIITAAPWITDGDVLIVTSKIVSKAEGRLVEVPADGPDRDAARAAVLAGETARVVARRGPTTIVQTHHGFVLAAAGIDASNVDKTHLVLLPADPDASARRLRADFRARGRDVGVVISDTMGRAWRNGLTDVALGAAGVDPFRDHRGETDPYGNELHLTQMAVIDELASAGELVKGKCDQVPVAVVRGYPPPVDGNTPGAEVLIREAASDLFSLGTAEARAAGLRDAALLPDRPPLAADRPHSGATAQAPDRPSPSADRPHPGNTAQPADRPTPSADRPHPGNTAQPPDRPPLSADGGHSGDRADGPWSGVAPGAAAAGAAPVDLGAVGWAIATVSGVLAAGTDIMPAVPAPGGAAILHVTTSDRSPIGYMRLGADVHRLRAALAAEGVASTATPGSDGIRLDLREI